jgi:hypothetical protein
MSVAIFLALEACRTGMLGGPESPNNVREKAETAVILLLDSCRTGMLGGFPETANSEVETPLTFILEQEACRTGMADGLPRSRSGTGGCILSACSVAGAFRVADRFILYRYGMLSIFASASGSILWSSGLLVSCKNPLPFRYLVHDGTHEG